MKAAELKIAKLDPIKDFWEITYLKFSASMQEIVLEQVLEGNFDLEKMKLYADVN